MVGTCLGCWRNSKEVSGFPLANVSQTPPPSLAPPGSSGGDNRREEGTQSGWLRMGLVGSGSPTEIRRDLCVLPGVWILSGDHFPTPAQLTLCPTETPVLLLLGKRKITSNSCPQI